MVIISVGNNFSLGNPRAACLAGMAKRKTVKNQHVGRFRVTGDFDHLFLKPFPENPVGDLSGIFSGKFPGAMEHLKR